MLNNQDVLTGTLSGLYSGISSAIVIGCFVKYCTKKEEDPNTQHLIDIKEGLIDKKNVDVDDPEAGNWEQRQAEQIIKDKQASDQKEIEDLRAQVKELK